MLERERQSFGVAIALSTLVKYDPVLGGHAMMAVCGGVIAWFRGVFEEQ